MSTLNQKQAQALVLASALLLAVACGGTPAAFSSKYADNDADDIELLLDRVNNAPPRTPSTVAVGVTSAPAQLYAYDLASQRLLWKQPVAATSAPFVAGESVIYQTADSVEAVSLRDGGKQVEVERGNKVLRGADGDRALAVFVMSEGMGTYAKSEIVLIRRGAIDWRLPIEGLVGVPAIAGTVVLVPWSNQFVTAIDIESGREVARVRVRDGVLAHAFRDREHTYVGSQHGITRVSASIGSGKLHGPGYMRLPEQNLPGRPMLLRDVYAETTPATPDSAQHRIALVWEPRALEGVRVGLEDDNVYLVFYAFVFALDPRDYAVRWVHRNDADIVGAAASPGGVIIGDEAGKLLQLAAASGKVVFRANSELHSTVVRIPMGARSTEPGAPLEAASLRAELFAAAQDTDARMVPGRLLAVRALAKLDDADATESLIALCDDGRIAPAVRTEACSSLKTRSLGVDHLLMALTRRASFLEGTTAPPVGALAKAAAAAKEKRAVAPLVLHLSDPATPSTDLAAVVTALKDLQDPSAAPGLRAFLSRYHADPIDVELVQALDRVPAALAALEGPAAIAVLEQVMGDAMGSLSVRQRARAELEKLQAIVAAEAAKAEAAKNPTPETVPNVVPVEPETLLPTHLSTDLINAALLPVRDKLQACLTAEGRNLFQARAVLVIEEGAVLMVSVMPSELQSCVEPLVRSQKFPQTRYPKKERLTYTVKR
jgi:outer membrane protein assembly factor BamB